MRSEARSGPDEGASARPSVRVVVVDDDDGFRSALCELLTFHGLEVVGAAADAAEALALVERDVPDVVLMDLAMPGMTGVEATRELVAAHPTLRVLILAMSSDEATVVEAMINGACGYVVKGTPPPSLVANIHAAAAGECVMSSSVATRLFQSLMRQREAPAPTLASAQLSKRELEVLTMLADGKQNTEIAESLVLSPYTVRNHISNLLRKLQLENRTQAARYAARHGLG